MFRYAPRSNTFYIPGTEWYEQFVCAHATMPRQHFFACTHSFQTHEHITDFLQLSKVYSEYGYDPAAGEVISGSDVEVTGSGNRVVYKRPAADAEPRGRWGR